jgi:hypothetical protein
MEQSMSRILFPSLIANPSYNYTIEHFSLVTGSLIPVSPSTTTNLGALEIEMETKIYWWIYLPANYHDSFYHTYFNSNKAVPTQVTGAVGEALALVIMRKVFQAKNVRRITPHPSSKSADFEMDIIENGKWVHAYVESKGSNRPYSYPPYQTVMQGGFQVVKTNFFQKARSGYLIITSYPSKTCFVIKVF